MTEAVALVALLLALAAYMGVYIWIRDSARTIEAEYEEGVAWAKAYIDSIRATERTIESMEDETITAEKRWSVSVGEVAICKNASSDLDQIHKILEEAAEVHGAWQELEHILIDEEYMGRFVDGEITKVETRLLDECADLITATCGLIHSLGVDSFTGFMEKCAERQRVRGRM